MGINLADL